MSLFILSLNNVSRDELYFVNFVQVRIYLYEYIINQYIMNNNTL